MSLLYVVIPPGLPPRHQAGVSKSGSRYDFWIQPAGLSASFGMTLPIEIMVPAEDGLRLSQDEAARRPAVAFAPGLYLLPAGSVRAGFDGKLRVDLGIGLLSLEEAYREIESVLASQSLPAAAGGVLASSVVPLGGRGAVGSAVPSAAPAAAPAAAPVARTG